MIFASSNVWTNIKVWTLVITGIKILEKKYNGTTQNEITYKLTSLVNNNSDCVNMRPIF